MKRSIYNFGQFSLNSILTVMILLLLLVAPYRAHAATFIVTTIEDSGPGSLRQATILM